MPAGNTHLVHLLKKEKKLTFGEKNRIIKNQHRKYKHEETKLFDYRHDLYSIAINIQ